MPASPVAFLYSSRLGPRIEVGTANPTTVVDDVGQRNIFLGGKGDDTLDGRAGGDNMHGGAGRDRLLGGAGDDFLSGGADADDLHGGTGADQFQFATDGGLAANGRADTVHDFSRAEGDKVYAYNFRDSREQDILFLGEGAVQGPSDSLARIRHQAHGEGDTLVQVYMADGDTAADLEILFAGAIRFTEGDFLLP